MKFALSESEQPGPVLDEKLPTTVKKLVSENSHGIFTPMDVWHKLHVPEVVGKKGQILVIDEGKQNSNP